MRPKIDYSGVRRRRKRQWQEQEQQEQQITGWVMLLQRRLARRCLIKGTLQWCSGGVDVKMQQPRPMFRRVGAGP